MTNDSMLAYSIKIERTRTGFNVLIGGIREYKRQPISEHISGLGFGISWFTADVDPKEAMDRILVQLNKDAARRKQEIEEDLAAASYACVKSLEGFDLEHHAKDITYSTRGSL